MIISLVKTILKHSRISMVNVRIIRHGNGDIELAEPELTWLWCSRPGGFNGSYTVIPIAGYIDRPELWQNRNDYDKMISTYRRVRKEIE